VLASLPFWGTIYTVGVIGRILAFGVLVASLDLLVGVAGLASLGHAAFFGAGAYAAAIVAREHSAITPVQLVVAAAVGAAAAALTGVVTVRSRGVYFLMLTLAIGELMRQLADSWTDLTGGTNGYAGVPPLRLVPGGDPVRIAGHVYWYVLAVAALAYVVMAVVRASPFGQSLRGLRDNEVRMRVLGYSTTRLKLSALAAAGAVAGVAGSLWVTQLRFVSPADLGFTTSALALLAVVIGGRDSLWGAFTAAGVVLVVRDELSSFVGGRGPLLLGLAFIAVVYFLPGGVAGLFRKRPHGAAT
jgi:branched-chain amino acid transport system permease protein